ncbi:MAG: hypothetical protein WDW38_000129 [Sanguina aurantia]
MAAVFDAQQFRRVGHFFGFGFDAPPIAKPQQKVVRIGLLGASQVSTYAVIAPARFLPGVEVVAVAARDSIRCQEFATQHKIPKAYGSYTELLDDPDIDAVYVGLPNGLHGQWAAAALSVGKSVLCEKPFTANVEEAGRVRDLARRKGRLCREAFHYREHPLMRSVQRQLAEGRLGELRELSVKVGARRAGLGGGRGLTSDVRRQSLTIAVVQAALSAPLFFVVGRGWGRVRGLTRGVVIVQAALSALCLRWGRGGAGGGQRSDVIYIIVRAALSSPYSFQAVLIPAWVFGDANIRFQHALAGGAMMDAGCYCVDVLRLLSGRGAAPRVDSAAATLMAGSDCVDAVMQAEVSWGGAEAGEGGGGGGLLRGRLHASLQHNGPFPVAEIFAEGTEGSMRLDSFIMPFFGHSISWETDRTVARTAQTLSASQLLDQQKQNQQRYQHQQRSQQRQQQAAAAELAAAAAAAGHDQLCVNPSHAWRECSVQLRPGGGGGATDTMSLMYDTASSAASGGAGSSGTDGVSGGGSDGVYGDMLWDDIRSTLEDVNAGWLFSTPALRRAHRQRRQATAAAAARRVRVTQREYGSAQQTTYYHQLSRFVDDDATAGAAHATSKERVLSSMDEELEASIANLSFIEGVYAAAGLPKRTPHSDWR